MNGQSQTINLEQLSGVVGNLLKIFGYVAGTSGLGAMIIYALGFVVVNTSLLRHGAYDVALLRAETLSAGISFAAFTLFVILAGAVLVHRSANFCAAFLLEKTSKRAGPMTEDEQQITQAVQKPYLFGSFVLTILLGIIILLVAYGILTRFSAGVRWWGRFGWTVVWGFLVALVGGIYMEYLDRGKFWEKLSSAALPEVGKPGLWGIGLLLVALITFGRYAYPNLPRSLGGGNPIYVEFLVDEQARAMLETLGLKVDDNGLTERVEYLATSSERIFIVTQQDDTLSFNPGLVEATKFYDLEYDDSADEHLDTGNWYRAEQQWENAIKEYSAALLLRADLVDALLGRGTAYTEKYLESSGRDTPDTNAYGLAYSDLTEAIRLIDEKKDKTGEALATFQWARLRLIKEVIEKTLQQDEKANALEDLKRAIALDPHFRTEAMLEEVFRKTIEEDSDFRRAISESDMALAEEYARLARETREKGEMAQAADLYEMAASLAKKLGRKGRALAAQSRANKADILEARLDLEGAIGEYTTAVGLDPDQDFYIYRLALLYYENDQFTEANTTCLQGFPLAVEAADNTAGAEIQEDQATIGCRIVLANIYRDRAMWDDATTEYTTAARQAVRLGAPVLAASTYYSWAQLEARRGATEQAIQGLEKAIWLDRSVTLKAENEADFDVLRELAGYQVALSPPTILKFTVNHPSEGKPASISFFLQEPADDFADRVTVLTPILVLADLVPQSGFFQADTFDVSPDGLVYTFPLIDSSIISDLVGALNKLGLAGAEVGPESTGTTE